ncbi:hypothetical protein RD792_012444, partial [Penstemon davidsonii]
MSSEPAFAAVLLRLMIGWLYPYQLHPLLFIYFVFLENLFLVVIHSQFLKHFLRTCRICVKKSVCPMFHQSVF